MAMRILVGIDFSPASQRALEQAVAWAGRLGATVTALHVIQEPAPSLSAAGYAVMDPTWVARTEAAAKAALAKWLQGQAGVEAEVTWGQPAKVLIASAGPGDLLVVGQKGHGAWEHFVFGATAAKVVAHATCPVLVVPERRS